MSEIPLQISPDGDPAVSPEPSAERQTVQESERRYRQLLEAVTSYTYSVDVVDGKPSSTVHRGGCLAATGYAPEEYRSSPYLWLDMVHPEDRPRVQEHVAKVLAGQDVPPLEHRILHKNGKTRWVRDTVVVHRDERGRVVRYDGLVEDITERKLVEDRFRRLLESAPDDMVVVDRGGQIVLVNSQTEKLFGYSREELLGQVLEVLLPERFRGPHAGMREGFFANPRTRPMGTRPHLPCRRKDGRQVLEEIKNDPSRRRIPVVILTTSRAEEDVLRAYDLHANCYITKPVDFDRFMEVIKTIEGFWLTVVKLPNSHGAGGTVV